MVHVLTILLKSDYNAEAWKGWVEGPALADATCQITEEQLSFMELDKLGPSHLPVLHHMHKHNAFDADAWQAMQTTVKRLQEAQSTMQTGIVPPTKLCMNAAVRIFVQFDMCLVLLCKRMQQSSFKMQDSFACPCVTQALHTSEHSKQVDV